MSSRSGPPIDPATLFAEAVSIMHRLRAPGGCPWDREQTFESVQTYTLEETYEVFDAIERRDWKGLCEELGDLLLQVLFYAEIAAEAGHFTIAGVVESLNRKLIRRHPHVFPEAEEDSLAAGLPTDGIDSKQVVRNWEAIKRAEKSQSEKGGHAASPERRSMLDAVPRALPALIEARKLGSRARTVGFDWPDLEGVFAKLQEETLELREAVTENVSRPASEASSQEVGAAGAIAAELGDLLFTTVNLARRLAVDPESALRHTNAKFRRRFAHMEAASEKPLEAVPPTELEALWSEAKKAEGIAAAL